MNAQSGPHKRVLLLYSYGPNFAPFDQIALGLRTELTRLSPTPVEYFTASLETMRFPETGTDTPLANYLSALFEETNFDLVVSLGGPAARFCLANRELVFPSTPLLAAGLERRVLAGTGPLTGATSLGVSVDLRGAIDHVLHLFPATTDIVLVSTGSSLGRFWVANARQELQSLSERVRFSFFYELSLEEMLERVSHLPPHTVIFYGGLIVDGDGVPYENGEALDRLHAASNAPIFGHMSTEMGRGIVGGRLMSIPAASRQAAEVAIRILGGEPPEEIDTAPLVAGEPVYDGRELERWGIPESSLPPGSTILFRSPSPWRTYMVPVVLGLGILSLETALIAGLLLQRARRRRAEEGARALSRRLITAQEDERRRLARELHDDLSQRLARVTIDVGRMEAVCGESTSHSASDALARLSEDVHALSYQLHPALIEDLGLCEALEEECERFADTEGVPAVLDATDLPDDLPRDASLCLFRVAQESLRNVSRHARASRVRVSIGPVNGGVRLVVSDDGIGFETTRSGQARLGHASMKERVALVAGKLEIDSGSGRGTTVTVWVPRVRSNEAST